MTDKKWYESKTMWLNIIAIVTGILAYVQGNLEVGSVITVAGVLNVILRLITTGKVVLK